MKPYTARTNAGRKKSRDDIHHKTADSGLTNRKATANLSENFDAKNA